MTDQEITIRAYIRSVVYDRKSDINKIAKRIAQNQYNIDNCLMTDTKHSSSVQLRSFSLYMDILEMVEDYISLGLTHDEIFEDVAVLCARYHKQDMHG